MKKAFYLLVVLVLVSCESPNEKKAKTVVVDYFKREMKDFSRYEPISWGKLDSCFKIMESDFGYKDLKSLVETAEDLKGEAEKEIFSYEETGIGDLYALRDSLTKREKELKDSRRNLERFTRNYQKRFLGFGIAHKYKAENEEGVLTVFDNHFIVSGDFEYVIGFAIDPSL